jgi:hypothetical protein
VTAAEGVRANEAVARRAREGFVDAARPEVADEVYAEEFEFRDPAHVFLPEVVDTPAGIPARSPTPAGPSPT